MNSKPAWEFYVLGFFLLIVLFFIILFTRGFFTNVDLEPIKETRIMMGSYVTLTVYSKEEAYTKQSMSKVFDMLKEIENIMSPTIKTSELSLLNDAKKPGKFKVSDKLWDVLTFADKINKDTEGAFDVTVAPLVEMWKTAEEKNVYPSEEEIKNITSRVGWDKVVLYPDTKEIEFKVEGMKITFGGIASGYAVDLARNIFLKDGLRNFLIDDGGDIYCSGQPGARKLWKIGIRDPLNKERIFKVVYLRDSAVVTSGNYERFYTIAGKQYSQIFSPKTGMPVDLKTTTSVIAKDTISADCWSTSLMVLGVEKGLELLKKNDGINALIITSDKGGKLNINTTDGFNQLELDPTKK